MRDFTWSYFSMTGDVNAYLLYKEVSSNTAKDESDQEEQEPVEAENAV